MTADTVRKPAQSSANRKISKGVIERKRRARINRSLSELKFLILSESSDKTLHSKLDKAEILERTLLHIQSLQTNARNTARSTNSIDINGGFANGYFSCVSEVDRFLCNQKVNQPARQQITDHLTATAQRLPGCWPTKSYPEMTQKLPSLAAFGSGACVANYAVVPGSPAPSSSSSEASGSSNDSRLSPFSITSSDASVWRPW